MGTSDTLMMLGVVLVGGYVALKVLPQLKLGGGIAPVQAAPIAPAVPVCGRIACDDQGDDVSCQCTGQAAFAMGANRTCAECDEVCKQRCAGQGNFVPDTSGTSAKCGKCNSECSGGDEDECRECNNEQCGGSGNTPANQTSSALGGVCKSEGGSWTGSCCSCPNRFCQKKCGGQAPAPKKSSGGGSSGGGSSGGGNKSAALKDRINKCAGLTGQTYNKCVGSYLARRVSYNTLLTAQTMNRIRRAKMAQAYYNMSYDPSRII